MGQAVCFLRTGKAIRRMPVMGERAMGISLSYEDETSSCGNQYIAGSVAHFGTTLAPGKPGVPLQGKRIAKHHGKIFYRHDSYRYANLSSLPTHVFHGRGFSFELDPLMPQCPITEGDRLRIGTAVVQIIQLFPPEREPLPRHHGAASLPVGSNATVTHCEGCSPRTACRVERVTGELAYRLREYRNHHEILRAGVDWLVDLYEGRIEDLGWLRIGTPEAIALRSRPGKVFCWQGYDLPIEKTIRGSSDTVAAVETKSAFGKFLDTGRTFAFRRRKGAAPGIAVGILEENDQPARESLTSGHVLAVQFSTDNKPTEHDLCVLQHVGTHISDALAMVEAARVRWQRDLERRAGMQSEGLFHDMAGICRGAKGAIPVARSQLEHRPAAADQTLAKVQQNLDWLERHIKRGGDAFEADQGFRYGCLDIVAMCENTLDWLFEKSPALRRTRDWRVITVPFEEDRLGMMPGDELAVQRILYNLVSNAKRAIDNREEIVPMRRLHIFIQLVTLDNLPYARIRVADNGAGLPEDALNVIFEGRFSTQTGRQFIGGKVVAAQVRKHLGFIEVASAKGKGTVVGVLLPAPAVEGRQPLQNPTLWTSPYAERASDHDLVSRKTLMQLLASDEQLKRWYKRQGATDNDSNPAHG